ncbi:MFS transporter [Rhodococcus sp. 15-2388-1-1a]|uniref:MFS transporter n=1 Tax=Nocardiaceae TaxID=85025 RepID=UPI00068A0E19|nr:MULTISPECIES: aromatic acid/H+ symport family MFS transporter [Rhodococcus]OZE99191.1 MFS transporter [Rhodococcus sp. 15-2388-1-1a]
MSRNTFSPVVALCLSALTLEGYDLLMYGTVVPSLLAYEPWDLDPATVGVLGSVVGVGMLVGALAAGSIADRWGRRRALIAAVALFSAAMGCCALAPSPETFGAARFVVGVGAGVLMPTAASMLIEFSRLDTRARTVALGFVGTSVGGIAAGILSLWLVPAFGFRAMFAAGMIPALLILPMMLGYLPESPAFLNSRGRSDAAQTISKRYGLEEVEENPGSDPTSTDRGIGALFTANRARVTLSFWVMTLLCLLVLFGVATWLPAVMRSAGYPLGAALSFLLVLNVGGAVGALGGAYLADRFGIKPVTTLGFLSAAVSLALIATTPPIGIVYVLVLIAGMGTTGTQILLNTFIGSYYPVSCRTTGLGVALAVGRLGAIVGPTYGGLFVAAGAGTSTQLLAFALPAIIGAGVTILVPTGRRSSAAPASVPTPSGRSTGRR